jgi:hypothetical protein
LLRCRSPWRGCRCFRSKCRLGRLRALDPAFRLHPFELREKLLDLARVFRFRLRFFGFIGLGEALPSVSRMRARISNDSASSSTEWKLTSNRPRLEE